MLPLSLVILLAFICSYSCLKSLAPLVNSNSHCCYNRCFLTLGILVFFLLSLGLYLYKASPFLPARPFEALMAKNPATLTPKEELIYLEAYSLRHPENAKILQKLALSYLKFGQVDYAINSYIELLELGYHTAPIYVGYGLALMAYNEPNSIDRAKEAFEKAAIVAPEDIYPRLFIAQCLAKKGHIAKAKAYLAKFLAQYPALSNEARQKIHKQIINYDTAPVSRS